MVIACAWLRGYIHSGGDNKRKDSKQGWHKGETQGTTTKNILLAFRGFLLRLDVRLDDVGLLDQECAKNPACIWEDERMSTRT